jgi:hypothetical protein
MSDNSSNPYQAPMTGPNSRRRLPQAVEALQEFNGVGPGGDVKYSIAADPMHHFLRHRLWDKFYQAFLVPDIVESPVGIWMNERISEDDSVYVIAGYPSLKFAKANLIDHEVEGRLDPNRVFVAFATENFVVSKWQWQDRDSDGSGFPSSHNAKYGAMIWPR